MPIHDLSQTTNAELQAAIEAAFQELIVTTDVEGVARILEAIRELREGMLVSHLADKLVVRNIWDQLRNSTATLGDLMSITSTFLMELRDVDQAIDYVANRLVPYTKNNSVVDREVTEKAIDRRELDALLSSNQWLFFLVVCSLNMRIVSAVVASVLKPPVRGK